MSINIGIPAEHHRRLQHLADVEGSSIAEIIADFVRFSIEGGRIPDEIPGWSIERNGLNVHFDVIDINAERTLSRDQAIGLADTFDRLSMRGAKEKAILDLDIRFKVERRGIAVKLTDLDTGRQRPIARSVVREIVRKLRDAAA